MIHLSRPFRGQKNGEKTWIWSAKRTKRRRRLRRVHTSGAKPGQWRYWACKTQVGEIQASVLHSTRKPPFGMAFGEYGWADRQKSLHAIRAIGSRVAWMIAGLDFDLLVLFIFSVVPAV